MITNAIHQPAAETALDDDFLLFAEWDDVDPHAETRELLDLERRAGVLDDHDWN